MAFELAFDDRAGSVCAVLHGEMDVAAVKAFFQAATDFARRRDCLKVLVDLRDFAHRLSTVELFNLSDFAEQQGIRHISRVALVIRESPQDSEDYQFVQAAFNNRGYHVRAFLDELAAREWLLRMDDRPIQPVENAMPSASLAPSSCDMTYDPASGIGFITAHGTFTQADFAAACRASIDFARRHQCLRVLVDYRQLEHSLSNPEIFRLFRSYETFGVNRNARIAYVASASAHNLDDLRFLEDLLVNHGFRVRAFVDIEQARRWLLAATD